MSKKWGKSHSPLTFGRLFFHLFFGCQKNERLARVPNTHELSLNRNQTWVCHATVMGGNKIWGDFQELNPGLLHHSELSNPMSHAAQFNVMSLHVPLEKKKKT